MGGQVTSQSRSVQTCAGSGTWGCYSWQHFWERSQLYNVYPWFSVERKKKNEVWLGRDVGSSLILDLNSLWFFVDRYPMPSGLLNQSPSLCLVMVHPSTQRNNFLKSLTRTLTWGQERLSSKSTKLFFLLLIHYQILFTSFESVLVIYIKSFFILQGIELKGANLPKDSLLWTFWPSWFPMGSPQEAYYLSFRWESYRFICVIDIL